MCVGMYICISRCTSASPSLPRAFSRTTAARAPAALAAFSAAYWGWQRRRMAPSHSIASCHSPTGAPPPLNRRAPPHRGHHVVEHAARRQGMARRTRCVLALRWCCILFWTRHIYLGATRPSTATHSRKGLPPSSTVGHPIRIVLLGRVAGWRRGVVRCRPERAHMYSRRDGAGLLSRARAQYCSPPIACVSSQNPEVRDSRQGGVTFCRA